MLLGGWKPSTAWILAVVYANDTNLNEKLVRDGYAEIMYIPPPEFNPYEWKADYTPTPIPTLSSMPCFEFLFDMIGILAAIYLIKRKYLT